MPAVAFSRLQAEMLALYSPPFRRKSTWFKLRTVLREFGELPGVKKSTDLTPLAIVNWASKHSHRAASTNRSYLLSLRATCTYAVKMGYLRTSPWEVRKNWIPDRPSATVYRHHSMADIATLLRLLDAEALSGAWDALRLQSLAYVYAYTGMRKMEALGLRPADVDLPCRIIFIRSHPARPLKTSKSEAPVGIPDELAIVLERWLPRAGDRWLFPAKTGQGFWNEGRVGAKPLDQVKAAGKRVGIPDLTIQSFRHSFATHSGRWGLGPLELKSQLRHTTLRTQEYYRGSDLADIRATASRVSYLTDAAISRN